MILDRFIDSHYNFLAPEVVQTSAMDCGPAALKSLLEGFGIAANYGRLREACQTDVDGTSIDIIEDVANQLGLVADQVMIPVDHILLPDSGVFPALAVLRLPNGLTHFVLIWRVHGRFLQIMDPGKGRRWVNGRKFLEELYVHTHQIPTADWREWAGTAGFLEPLAQRMAQLDLDQVTIDELVQQAASDPTWFTLGVLDAVVRMVDSMVRADGINRGEEAHRVVHHFLQEAQEKRDRPWEAIPFTQYWSVLPTEPQPDQPPLLAYKGAVMIQVAGRLDQFEDEDEDVDLLSVSADADELKGDLADEEATTLSPELAAALAEPETKIENEIWALLRQDGLLVPSMVVMGLLIASISVLVETLLFRGLLDLGTYFALPQQRISAMLALLFFLTLLLALEWPLTNTILRIGLRLEVRLRVAFLEKIPRLGDRYFRSRLTSDMTDRAHGLRQLRNLRTLASQFIRLIFQLILTTIAVAWLEPSTALIALLGTLVSVAFSIATRSILAERDLRMRTHGGALSRFYLDAFLGLSPIRTHKAEPAVRHEHESLLVEWAKTNREFQLIGLVLSGAGQLLNTIFAVWILFAYVARGGDPRGVLLLFYWTLRLPEIGQQIANIIRDYTTLRNALLRLLEPLHAPDEESIQEASSPNSQRKGEARKGFSTDTDGIAITMSNVTVHAGGNTVLDSIDLELGAGEHIAVVGPSGAGKSSLVGLLLGWHWPADGVVQIDGQLLTGERIPTLRQETAWVDPAIQLWNRSLLDNLYYGNSDAHLQGIDQTIRRANLFNVLERLPNGLQTQLGEDGGLVSGGEGQRVRLGRAMLRQNVRLVVMDEPFRGLDRPQREQLLRQAREHWQGATLIFISHDIGNAQLFDRVLVVENGRLVEDDTPTNLTDQADSRFSQLLQAEEAVRRGMWGNPGWRRLWLENGNVEERTAVS